MATYVTREDTHCDCCTATFLAGNVPPSELCIHPFSRACLIIVPFYVVDGEQAHVLAVRVARLQERGDCIAHCDEWIIGDAECDEKH
jgi:hypothetical protein